MQVNFQFIFSIKFTGKIKSILKLTMLRKFCEPETEGLHSSMQNMHFTFQLISSTYGNTLGKEKVFWAFDAGQISIDF